MLPFFPAGFTLQSVQRNKLSQPRTNRTKKEYKLMSNTTKPTAISILIEALKSEPGRFQNFCSVVNPKDHVHFSSVSVKGKYHTLWLKPGKGIGYKSLLDSIDGGEGRLSLPDKAFLKLVWEGMNEIRAELGRSLACGAYRITLSKRGFSGGINYAEGVTEADE